jgi:hypothetical protein
MLFELDADQRLWQDTVRDAVGKQCPPELVRSVAEDGADPTPVWKVYIEQGWTELRSSLRSCWRNSVALRIRHLSWPP